MFTTSFAGKAGSVVMSYDSGEFVAAIAPSGKAAKVVRNGDLNVVFKSIRSELDDRSAMLAVRSFSRNMGQAMKVMSQQRRLFLKNSKSAFKAIRAKSPKKSFPKKAASKK